MLKCMLSSERAEALEGIGIGGVLLSLSTAWSSTCSIVSFLLGDGGGGGFSSIRLSTVMSLGDGFSSSMAGLSFFCFLQQQQ